MKSDILGTTYLLHLNEPLGRNHHYLGWTNDLPKRLESHRSGPRERCVFTHECQLRGITWVVAATWEDVTIAHEKTLKRQRNHKRFCPVCKEKK